MIQPRTVSHKFSWISDENQEAEHSFIETTSLTQPLLEPISDEEPDSSVSLVEHEEETSLSICLQVTLPYIIAGFGMVLAGMVLDVVQVCSTIQE